MNSSPSSRRDASCTLLDSPWERLVIEHLEPRRLLSADPTPTDALYYIGDTNRSGAVDFADFLTLRSKFGTSTDAGPAEADFNLDGKVDFSDFLTLRGSFGRTLDHQFSIGEARSALTSGFGQIELNFPDWAGAFDLQSGGNGGDASDAGSGASGLDLPVIGEDFNTLFDLNALLSGIDLPDLSTAASFSALETILADWGFAIDAMPSGSAGGQLQVRWSHTFDGLSGSFDFDDTTVASLAELIPGADLNGTVSASAELAVTLVFGVDAGGFYLLGESAADLHVTAAGNVNFAVPVSIGLGGDLAINGDGEADADVSVRVGGADPVERYRMPQLVRRFGSEVVALDVDGAANLGLNLSLQPVDLGFSGQWAFAFDETGDVDLTSAMQWPSVDDLVAAALPAVRSGLSSILGPNTAALLDSLPMPLAGGAASADDPAGWFVPLLEEYVDLFNDPTGEGGGASGIIDTLAGRGITFETLPSPEQLIALLQGTPIDGDLIRVNVATAPEGIGPFTASYDFNADDVGGLAGLGFNGSIAASAAPAFNISLGYDAGGFYFDPASDARALVSATANATGSYGAFAALAEGVISLAPRLDVSGADADTDGKLRAGEFADNLAAMRLHVEDVSAELAAELRVGLLDYIDADGNAGNNTSHGGDPFRFRGSSSAVASQQADGSLAIDWGDATLENPDVNGDGVDDFTTAVLLRNVAELVKDVTSGNRSLFGESAFSGAVNATSAPLTSNGIGSASGLTDARPTIDFGNLDSISDISQLIADHIQVLHVVDLTTVASWLNGGLPATPADLLRLKVDTGTVGLLPAGGLTADLSQVLPADAGWTGGVGLSDASFVASLVFGFDTSTSGFYLQTAGDALSGEASSLTAGFTATASLSNPQLLPDILSLDRAEGSISPQFAVDFSNVGGADGKLHLDDLSGLSNLSVTLAGDPVDSLVVDLQATLTIPGLELNGHDVPAEWTLTGQLANRAWSMSATGGVGLDYELHGFAVDELSASLAVDGTQVTAELAGRMRIALGQPEDPVLFNFDTTFTNDGFDLFGEVAVGQRRIGDVLEVQNGVVTVDLSADFNATNVFTGQVSFAADTVTFLPDSGPEGMAQGTGLNGTLDSSGNLTASAETLWATLNGLVEVDATDVALSVGPNATGDLLSVGGVTAEIVALDVNGEAPALVVTNLRLTRDGRWLFDAAEVQLPAGYSKELGIAELLPFELEAVLLDTIDGDLNDFDLSIRGRFDVDQIAADWGFTPIVQVGGSTGDNGVFEATLSIEDLAAGKISLKDFGPVTLGFADWEVGAVTLAGQITLGGYQDGLFVPNVAGSFSIQSGLVGTSGDDVADGISIDGATFALAGTLTPADQNGGVTALDVNISGDVKVRFKLAGLLDFRGVNFNFDLLVTNPANTFDPSVDVSLNQIGFDYAQLSFAGLMTLTATGGLLDFEGSQLVSFDDVDVAFDGLDGWGGSFQNLQVNDQGIPQLAGLTVQLQLPPDLSSLFPDWLPLQISELGLRFHEALFDVDDSGVPVGVNDPFAFSVLFSGGLQAVPDGFPINASFDGLEIDIAAAKRGEFPIKNLDGVSIGIEPFELVDGFQIGGGLSFGTAEVDMDNDPATTGDIETALYVRIYGAFEINGIGASIDLVMSEYGPVLAGFSAPLAIPLGQTSLIISGVNGGIAFGQTLPDVEHPQDLQDSWFGNPLDDVTPQNIERLIGTAVRAGVYSWETPFTMVLGGTVTSAAAPGVITGDIEFLANVGIPGLGGTGGGSLNLMGFGDLNVMGMGVAGVKLLAQFNDPLNPKFAALFTAPQPGTPLGFLLPFQANVGALIDTKGLAAGTILGTRIFVQRVVDGTIEVGQELFSDTLDAIALSLNSDRDRPLSVLLLDVNGDGTVSPTEDQQTIDRVFLVDRVLAMLPTGIAVDADGNPTIDLQPAQRLVTAFTREVFDAAGGLLSGTGSYDLTGAGDGFDPGVTAFFSAGQEAVLAFAKVIADAAADAVEAALPLMDPKLIISAEIQPVIAGIPMGQPDGALELTLSKQGLAFGIEVSPTKMMLKMTNVVGAVISTFPLPISERIFADVQLPFGDTDAQVAQVLRDLLNGRIPTIDPLSDQWSVSLAGAYDVFGYPVGTLSGFMFPENWSQAEQRIQKVWLDPDAPLDPSKVQITESQWYDSIIDFGGILIDGSLNLPVAFQDPQALIASLTAPPSDPADLLAWITNLAEQIQAVDEAATATAYIPGFADLFVFNFANPDGETDGLSPRITLAPGVTQQDVEDRINAAFFEGVFNGKILGIQLGEGRVRATAESVTAVGSIPWLGLDAAFSLSSREEQVDDGAGGTRTIDFPMIAATLEFDTSEFGAAFANWGLAGVQLPAGATGSFRAYSPGFDPASPDRLQQVGGIGMDLALSIPGLLSQATFSMELTPPADGSLVPDFVATATAVDLDLLGDLGGLSIDSATVKIIKQGSNISFEIDGVGTLMGVNVTVSGTLDENLEGTLTITADSPPDILPGFAASGVFSAELYRDGADNLQTQIEFIGHVTLPAALGGTSVEASGSFASDTGAGSVALNITSLTINGFTLEEGSFTLIRDASGNVSLDVVAKTTIGGARLDVTSALSITNGIPNGTLDVTLQNSGDTLTFGTLTVHEARMSLWFLETSARLHLSGNVSLPLNGNVAFNGYVTSGGDFNANLTLSRLALPNSFAIDGIFSAAFTASTATARVTYKGTVGFGDAIWTVSGDLTVQAAGFGGTIWIGSTGTNTLPGAFTFNGQLGLQVTNTTARVYFVNTSITQAALGTVTVNGWLNNFGYGSLTLTTSSRNMGSGFTINGTFTYQRQSTYTRLAINGTTSFAGLTLNVSSFLNVSSVLSGNLTITTTSGSSNISYGGLTIAGSGSLYVSGTYVRVRVAGTVNISGVASGISASGDLDSNGYGTLNLTMPSLYYGGFTIGGSFQWENYSTYKRIDVNNGTLSFLNNNLAVDGYAQINASNQLSGDLTVRMSSGSNFNLGGFNIGVGTGFNGAMTISKTPTGAATFAFDADVDIPGLVTNASLSGSLNTNGLGNLSIDAGDGFRLGNSSLSQLVIGGTFILSRYERFPGDTSPATRVSVTDASLAWNGVTAFTVNNFTIDSTGYFNASVVGKTISLSTGLGALSLTIPSATVLSSPSTGTYNLTLSAGSIDVPLFEEDITTPTITVGTSGTFSRTLGTKDIDIGGVVDLYGSMTFERLSTGVFRLYVTSGRLQITNWVDITLNNFYIDSNGNFDVSATSNQFGPDFFHIDASSIQAETYTYTEWVQVGNLFMPVSRQGFRVFIDGGYLDLPIGESIALPDIYLDTGMTWSHTVTNVADLDMGYIDIDGGDWAITFSNGRLAMDLVGSARFDINAAGNSTMTVNDFDIGINGNGSGQTFSGNVRGRLNLYGELLGTATYTIDMRTSGSTRYLRMSGDANLYLGWATVVVGGWFETRDGGYFNFDFDGSLYVSAIRLAAGFGLVGASDPDVGYGTISTRLWKNGSSLGFSGSIVGAVNIGFGWWDVNWSFTLSDDEWFWDFTNWFYI